MSIQFLNKSLSLLKHNNFFRFISTSNRANMPLKPGDRLPAVELMENNPGNKIKMSDLKGKVVIFGVPGAFTPTCSNDHAPGYINAVDDLKSKGVDTVVCLSVNDPFVMEAWGKSLNAGNKVRFLADTCGEFAKQADLSLDATGLLGNVRCKRFVLVADDGVVKNINIEPDGIGLTCSKVEEAMKLL